MECPDPARLLGQPDPSRDDLLLSALAPRPLALAAWNRWERSHVDPDCDPIAARWLPLIGWHLDQSDLSDQSQRRLKRAGLETWAFTMRLCTATEPALERLEAAGIEWMLLKGAALAWTVYESPALRPIGDVDVLVRPSAADDACTLLEAAGWRAVHRAPSIGLATLHGINYTKAPHGALDLHRFALRECCWPDADAGFWQRSVTTTIGDRAVRILSPVDQLLQVCVHGLRWNPVHSSHWVADAARIIARAGDGIDWPVLVEETRQRDLSFQLHGALAFVRRVAGARVPDAVLAALTADRVSLRARMERRVKTRPLHRIGGLLLMWYDWRRLRTARSSTPAGTIGFLQYLAHSMRLSSPWELLPWAARCVKTVATGRRS